MRRDAGLLFVALIIAAGRKCRGQQKRLSREPYP